MEICLKYPQRYPPSALVVGDIFVWNKGLKVHISCNPASPKVGVVANLGECLNSHISKEFECTACSKVSFTTLRNPYFAFKKLFFSEKSNTYIEIYAWPSVLTRDFLSLDVSLANIVK